MLLLGRFLFVAGFLGLAVQIIESWFGLFGLPITNAQMMNALLWWMVFGAIAAGGVWLMKRSDPNRED